MRRRIPQKITKKEVILRAIFDPFSYSHVEGRVTSVAFMPSSGRNDISVMRRRFVKSSVCKRDFMKIPFPGHQYYGIATFWADHIEEINNSTVSTVKPKLIFSPMYANETYRQRKDNIYRNTRGKGAHSDIIYPVQNPSGSVQNQMRKFAKKLAQIVNFKPDPYPKYPMWLGKPLIWEKAC